MKKKIKFNDVSIRVMLFLLILAVFSIIQPSVLSATNIFSMINDTIFNGIAALGMMTIMITGNFDLSSTSIAMLASFITLKFYSIIGYEGDFITMFLIAAVFGALIAMINGFITQKFNLSGFVWSREAPPCHIAMVGLRHPLREPDLHLSMYPALLSFGQ